MADFKDVGSSLLVSCVSYVKPAKSFPVASALLAVTLSALPFTHRAATAQAGTDERTIVMCETSSVAVRVYEKEGEVLMRTFSRTQNSLLLNDVPIEIQSLADGTEYRNPLGEMMTTVNANTATDDCTIQIADQPAELGRILERGALPSAAEEPAPTEPAPTEPEPTEPAPTEPAPTEPVPTEPEPTEPAPTEPAPTEPEPTEPAPTEPAPTEPEPTEPEPTEPEPTEPDAALPSEVEMAVKAALSAEIGDIVTTVESYSPQTWSDGCLGLGGPAEACLAALTEGWQVEMVDSATGDRYTYRTDEDGSAVRLDENASLPPSS